MRKRLTLAVSTAKGNFFSKHPTVWIPVRITPEKIEKTHLVRPKKRFCKKCALWSKLFGV
jgi:hypothetical protein